MNPHGAATTRPRRPFALILRGAYYFFLMSGILGLVYAACTIVDAGTYQARETARFENVKVSRSEGPPRQVPQGEVIGEMEVPRLALKAIFVQGDSAKILRRAVGHIPETALPGAK